MAMYLKTIVAGPLVMQALYPAPNPRDPRQVRIEKNKVSSEALRRMNAKYAYQKLELTIAANFRKRDIWAVLTYDDAHLPKSREEAMKRVQLFLRKLRRARGSEPLKAVYNTEHKHFHEDYFQNARYHHHILINATGADYNQIRKAWPYGIVLIQSLRIDREKSYESLARYMLKEQRDKLGQRAWSCTRNLSKPVTDRVSVDNDAEIELPKQRILLIDTNSETVYGRYRHVKYILPCDIPSAPKVERMHAGKSEAASVNGKAARKVRLRRRI